MVVQDFYSNMCPYTEPYTQNPRHSGPKWQKCREV